MSVDPVVAPDEQLSVEVDGYRLTLPGRSDIFEVTDVATGEVVVSERPLGPGVEGGWLTFDACSCSPVPIGSSTTSADRRSVDDLIVEGAD